MNQWRFLRKELYKTRKRKRKCIDRLGTRTTIIFTGGNNISDNKPISATVQKYLSPPGAVVDGKKIPSAQHRNPLSEIPTNLLSTDLLKYVYDDSSDIKCGVNPSNLVAPMKINDNLKNIGPSRSSAFHKNTNPDVVDLAKAIGSLNPIFFDPSTESQDNRGYVPDLVYYSELDKVNSLHNAIANPNGFIPPPTAINPISVMTSQSLTNTNYYPTSNNFFQKDPFACYQSTMSLIHQMNNKKPAHLIEHDRRLLYNNNHIIAAPRVKPFEPLSPDAVKPSDRTHASPQAQVSPPQSIHDQLSPPKYDVRILDQSTANKSTAKKSDLHNARQNIRMQEDEEYGSDSQANSPASNDSPVKQVVHQNVPAYPKYSHYEASDEQCRKELPDRQFGSPSSDEEDRSDNRKRVMFQDDKIDKKQLESKNRLKKQMFEENRYGSGLKSEDMEDDESYNESPEKYQKAPDYQHFHDESMSKLEAVLQRQRERLENMGGFSGKSSQISKKSDGTEQNLEDVSYFIS